MKKTFVYLGTTATGVTFGRGKQAHEVRLVPNRTVSLDAQNSWVQSSVAKGLLRLVESAGQNMAIQASTPGQDDKKEGSISSQVSDDAKTNSKKKEK